MVVSYACRFVLNKSNLDEVKLWYLHVRLMPKLVFACSMHNVSLECNCMYVPVVIALCQILELLPTHDTSTVGAVLDNGKRAYYTVMNQCCLRLKCCNTARVIEYYYTIEKRSLGRYHSLHYISGVPKKRPAF